MNLPADDERAIALVVTIRSGDLERLRQMLSDDPGLAQARIVSRGGTARTLLHVAADWPGHFPRGAETVAVLVAAGADVNAALIHRDPKRPPETALHGAASSDDVAVLDALVAGGADIEAPGAVFTGGSPMSDAVVFAQWKAARRLLEHGARTTIWQAAALGLIERVRELFESAPPSAEQITNCFWHACRSGQRATAEFFLDRGANLNWVGYDDKTPLAAARESGAEDLVLWLQSRGA